MRKIILPCLIALCLSFDSFSQGTCATATPLIIDGACHQYPMGALGTGANFSPVGTPAAIACGPAASFPANRRVTWFRFTPATNLMTAEFRITTPVLAPTQVVFYDAGTSGACTGTLQADAPGCDIDGQDMMWYPSNVNILRAGRTYYLRVYVNTTVATALDLDICVNPVTIHTIPLDDVQHLYSVGPRSTIGTARNYNPMGTANGGCNYSVGMRVTWFQFTPTATVNCATFNINADVADNTEVAFYDPTLANPLVTNSTLCMVIGSGVFAPKLPFTLVAGRTYYLRIYTNINDDLAHDISIQAKAYSPPNDFCTGATQLDFDGINNENNVCATGEVTGQEPTYIANNSSGWICTPTMHNTAWYYIEVQSTATPITIEVTNINCVNLGTENDRRLQIGTLVWDGGDCSTPNNLQMPGGVPRCLETINGQTNAVITIPAGVVPAGQRVYITMDGRNNSNCSYTILPGNAIPIPVKLRYFTAWKQAGRNQLKWMTETELNNAYFEIERSTDGKTFLPIGRVEGAGSSTNDVQYKFDDVNYPAVAYYRLKQVDFDGKYEYSNVIMLKREDVGSMLAVSFANPVVNNNRVTISTHRPGLVNLRVVDVAGRTLSSQQVECIPGSTSVMKDFSKLAAGSYYLVVTQGDDKLVKPFIKQ